MSSVGEELGGVARNTKRMRTSSVSSDQEGRFGGGGGGGVLDECVCMAGWHAIYPSHL